MQVGDRIRIQRYIMGHRANIEDFTVEEFRFCLGIFEDDQRREAGQFTPLCHLYEPGPDSVTNYIPNFGEYFTDPVQGWMDLPKVSE